MFKHSAFLPHKFDEMYEDCPVCDLHYEREPGFFFGAMYITYSLNVAVLVTIFIILYNFLGNPELWVYIASVLSIVILFLPFVFRLSRAMYLHFFGGVKYDDSYQNK
ncbi:MAG: DUF983 domain-containing protein [Cyclobacteriaceae bacterium]|nr:DUF983 domain-containing protein [Cyclobacteriaceae bacterium]MCH8515163.1 DUF983 domain-containing protein [Cyclobacteriaceae bacterium]